MTASSKALAAALIASSLAGAPLAAQAAADPIALAADPALATQTPEDAAAEAAFDPLAARPEARLHEDATPAKTAKPAAVMGLVSPAPEPATWAMMLAGFGGAGALLRSRRRGGGQAYRLVEALPDGSQTSEEFAAPDDATALRRAAMVAEGHIELWRGDVRIAPVLNA